MVVVVVRAGAVVRAEAVAQAEDTDERHGVLEDHYCLVREVRTDVHVVHNGVARRGRSAH